MQDRISAAVPVFLKSCARFLTRADSAPLDAVAMSVDFGRVGDWRSFWDAGQALPARDRGAGRGVLAEGFPPVSVTAYAHSGGPLPRPLRSAPRRAPPDGRT